jgi:hypothetical protein
LELNNSVIAVLQGAGTTLAVPSQITGLDPSSRAKATDGFPEIFLALTLAGSMHRYILS